MERERERPSLPVIAWLAYNALVVPVFIGAMHLGRFFDDKIREGMDGRRRLWNRLDVLGERLQGCVWVHASSAGEYEQARPVIRALRERFDVPVLLTVFSPSGHAHATQHPEADAVEYLPLDSMPAAERMLGRLRPRALVFVRYDCWPNLVWSAVRRGVPTVLLGGSLHARSQRLNSVARPFFESVYRQFDAIGAVDTSHAARFRSALGVADERVSVTGDTRIDQVKRRFDEAADAPVARALQDTGWRYVVVGSSWPADEQVWVNPVLDGLRARSEWGLVVAPHEPTPEHLEALERRIADAGLDSTRLSELVELRSGEPRSTEIDRDRWRVILVDGVGLLASIYRAGSIAYVGGGFTTGVHNVMEPAVCGLPVLFGPRHTNAVEAGLLIERGGGRAVEDIAAFRRELAGLFDDDEHRQRAGTQAARLVEDQAGATERSVELLAPYLSR
jgi:3-deoxy-D-manno-octulosonic-acid transferase